MKWLLVTTIGKNPGDEFIRVGIKRLIESVDKNPEYILIDKEDRNQWRTPVEFDKAVWCGMPVFWSVHNNSSMKVFWSSFIKGWVSARKKDFIILGAGSFAEWGREQETLQRAKDLEAHTDILLKRSFKIVARDPIVSRITNRNIDTLVCPAVFGIKDMPKEPSLKLVNLMPDGAHYRDFGRQEAKVWDSVKKDIGCLFLNKGWTFISHNDKETKFAKQLGWSSSNILSFNTKNVTNCIEMLGWYSRAEAYFGNRVHGAIVARGNGGDVWGVGYDSRQEAVKVAGARVSKPSELNLDEIEGWATTARRNRKPYPFKEEFKKQQKILQDFMHA